MQNTTWPDDGPPHAPVARPFATAVLLSAGAMLVMATMALLRVVARGAWLLPVLTLGSCAAMFGKGPFPVPVDSSPQGAIVSYRGNDVGRTPWRRWMELALGHLRMAPATFWAYSLKEWLAAVDGYRESLGMDESSSPMTRDELASLMEEHPDK